MWPLPPTGLLVQQDRQQAEHTKDGDHAGRHGGKSNRSRAVFYSGPCGYGPLVLVP
jgi:hypothetical protein